MITPEMKHPLPPNPKLAARRLGHEERRIRSLLPDREVGKARTVTRVLIAAVLAVGLGCAKADWIDRTLVTETVAGAWTGSMVSPDGQPMISQEVRLELQQEGPRV